jgi:murein DD-endopeptidase MepM/ murein hydrolase activator NlpD
MKKWTIFLLDRSSRCPVRFRAGKVVYGLALLALAAAAVGWGRMTVVAVSAVHTYYTISKYRADSTLIQTRLSFLNKQLASHILKLRELSDYEKMLRLCYGLRSVPEDVRRAGIGGIPSLEELAAASFGGSLVKRVYDLEVRTAALARQVALEDSLLAESGIHTLKWHQLWAQTPSIRPAEGRLASRFGWRADPMGGYDTRFHEGIDLANSTGTPIHASADGIVRFTGTQEGFGNVVRIRHESSGVETVYGHMDSFKVKPGEKVKRGEFIGLMGNTGRSTGPHLHYEVRKSGKSQNPQSFILPESLIVD